MYQNEDLTSNSKIATNLISKLMGEYYNHTPATQSQSSCEWHSSSTSSSENTSSAQLLRASSHKTPSPKVQQIKDSLNKVNLAKVAQPKLPSNKVYCSPNESNESSLTSLHLNDKGSLDVSEDKIKLIEEKDKYWYKPNISLKKATRLLKDLPIGTFIVRDSHSFPGCFGLALKIGLSTDPDESQINDKLVRHYLIKPKFEGVQLRCCNMEPVFTCLQAFLYQHSISEMALPCCLVLPDQDIPDSECPSYKKQLKLSRKIACDVLYLLMLDVKTLTGPQAIQKTVSELFLKSPLPTATVVHFKVNAHGIMLTDSKLKYFIRKHYPCSSILYCGLDPDEHKWVLDGEVTDISKNSTPIFGLVVRKEHKNSDNMCLVFAEINPMHPATSIVNIVNKVLSTSGINPTQKLST